MQCRTAFIKTIALIHDISIEQEEVFNNSNQYNLQPATRGTVKRTMLANVSSLYCADLQLGIIAAHMKASTL